MSDQDYSINKHISIENAWIVRVNKNGSYAFEYYIFKESKDRWVVRVPINLTRNTHVAKSLGEAIGIIIDSEED